MPWPCAAHSRPRLTSTPGRLRLAGLLGLAAIALACASQAGGLDSADLEAAVPERPSDVAAPTPAPVSAASPSPERAEVAPDPAARLPGGKQGSEYWDLVAKFESGHVVFARFLLTNVGPGEHSAVVLGHVITPSGDKRPFRNGRRRSRWQLSDDRLKLDINKCHLDLRGGTALLTVRKSSVALSLRFALEGGALPPSDIVPDRYAVETLAANAPVQGTIQLYDMPEPLQASGTGAVMHTWTADPEEERVQRRLDFFTLTPGLGLQLSEIRTPQGDVRRWLRATRSGRTVLERTSVSLDVSGQLAGTPSRYPVESNLRLDAESIGGDLALGTLLHQQDPLEAIPQPLRSVIRWSISSEPHQLWTTAGFDLSLELVPGAPPTPLRGEGIAAIAFLSEE